MEATNAALPDEPSAIAHARIQTELAAGRTTFVLLAYFVMFVTAIALGVLWVVQFAAPAD